MAQDSTTVAAAEKGDLIAQINLGIGYRDGKFGEKDPSKAFTWISRAAESGDAAAQDHLGWLVENGIGTAADEAKARELYRLSAEAGHLPAINNLARCWREHLVHGGDKIEALRATLEAWQKKPSSSSANNLATVLIAQESLLPHEALIDQLCTVESAQVLTKMGRIYLEGLGGISRNQSRALELFTKAQRFDKTKNQLDALAAEELAARSPARGEFAFLRTAHLEQGFNMCAPTSAAVALEFYLQNPVDPYFIKNHSTGATTPRTGTAWDCMMHGIAAASGGDQWEFRSWPNDDAGFTAGLPVLLSELDAGRIALIDLGPHTVVLVGFDARQQVAYINNPAIEWPGIQAISYDDLRQKWHSPWHLTTTRGVEARPVLLTGESAKRKKAGS